MRRFSGDKELGLYAAERIAEIIKRKPEANICIAAGTSSFPVFDALIEKVEAGELSFSRARFLGMDEWCGLKQDADGAMADFLRRHFLNHVDFKEEFLFDGMADPEKECLRAEEFFKQNGELDIIVFGIGVNGHVALNEPGVNPELRTHVAEVAEITANVAQKYFENKAPKLSKGVSIGLANAAQAGEILLVANTPNKRPAIDKLMKLIREGNPNNSLPSSIVAAMPQTELLITEAVYS